MAEREGGEAVKPESLLEVGECVRRCCFCKKGYIYNSHGGAAPDTCPRCVIKARRNTKLTARERGKG